MVRTLLMDEQGLAKLLDEVRAGRCSPDEAVARLRFAPIADLHFAQVDTHRMLRQGHPEIVYAPGKTPEQIAAIVGELLSRDGAPILVTRLDPAPAETLLAARNGGEYVGRARLGVWRRVAESGDLPRIAVVTAGTSDQPVSDEAEEVARALGAAVQRVNDVGVAGIHRILKRVHELDEQDVIIVVAGMEGALPSVVAGLVGVPVVAVPTSVGYGAAFDGLAALLGMLTSCASGVVVVNIDSGFSAAMAAFRMARAAQRIARR